MLKHVYRAIILVAIFFCTFFLLSKNIKEEKTDISTTVTLSDATFPILYIQTNKEKLNTLHGYSSNMDANIIREGITPLDNNNTYEVLIDENESKVKKIKYQVREIDGNVLVESGSVSNLSKTKKYKTAKIRIKENLELNKEYAVQMTVITNTSKKINYYTRVKALSGSHLKEKLDFVLNFHNSIMDKKKANNIIAYLEPDVTKENTDLSNVNINSSFDLISWSNLKPSVVNEIVPTINEINDDTASITLNYIISSKATGKRAYYIVNEFYRVRFTATRLYLLNYERKMESIYDNKLIDTKNKLLNIGITNDTHLDFVSNKENTKFYFVRERALWYYDLEKNNAVKVFCFYDDKLKDIRTYYDQHNIRILNMDEDGNINFMVYGYMNRGDYEGKVAIILYKFFSAENRIEERVYIPMEKSYQMLNQNLDEFSYVNESSVFYFSMDNTIYSYNILTKNLEEIATNINTDQLAMSKEGKYIAWQDAINPKKTKTIHLLDLESGNKKIIKAPAGNNIKVLGDIAQNIIYGYCKTTDITKTTDGSYLVPLNKIQIASRNGKVLKTYSKRGYYVTKVIVKDNIVELERVKKKVSNGKNEYDKVNPDYIINNRIDSQGSIELSKRHSNKVLDESIFSLPSEVQLSKIPTVQNTVNTIITEDTTLIINQKDTDLNRFYVYATGNIEDSFSNVSDAIVMADDRVGVVIDKKQKIIWERGGKNIRNEIIGIAPIYVDGKLDSFGACIKMVLQYNKIPVAENTNLSANETVYDVLNDNLGYTTLNLTGCTLDEVLYFVSKGNPVIAMKDKNHAVLITSYDEFNITVVDSSTRGTKKIGLKDGAELFKKAGNVFISYMK